MDTAKGSTHPRGKSGRIGWRLVVCSLLMLWIFHVIFLQEGKNTFSKDDWIKLTRLEQWKAAWVYGPIELWNTLTLVQPGAAFLSVVLMGLTLVLGVVRWQIVLKAQGLPLSFGRAAEISLVAHFFNSFLLGSSGGDLMKAYYAARETHHKKPEAVAAVFADRLLGLLSMLLFAAVMMIPNLSLILSHDWLAALSSFILVMFVACAGVSGIALWGGLSRQLPQARGWLRKLPKGESLERTLDACRSLGKRPRVLLEVLAVSTILNAVCVCQFIVIARGIDLPSATLSASALFLIVPMIICASAIPITPSGLGVRENLYVLILAAPQMGINAKSALSLSLLAYAGSLLWSLIGGLVYVTFKERHHLDEFARDDIPPS